MRFSITIAQLRGWNHGSNEAAVFFLHAEIAGLWRLQNRVAQLAREINQGELLFRLHIREKGCTMAARAV